MAAGRYLRNSPVKDTRSRGAANMYQGQKDKDDEQYNQGVDEMNATAPDDTAGSMKKKIVKKATRTPSSRYKTDPRMLPNGGY